MAEPFRQGDERWRKTLLGNSPSTTMHKGGCLVTSIAEIARHYGRTDVTPAIVNTTLRALGKFLPKSGMLGDFTGAEFGFRMDVRERTTTKMDDMNRRAVVRDAVIRVIEQGHVAILKVKHGPLKNTTHFISLIREMKNGHSMQQFICADPAYGEVILTDKMIVALPGDTYHVVEVRPAKKI